MVDASCTASVAGKTAAVGAASRPKYEAPPRSRRGRRSSACERSLALLPSPHGAGAPHPGIVDAIGKPVGGFLEALVPQTDDIRSSLFSSTGGGYRAPEPSLTIQSSIPNEPDSEPSSSTSGSRGRAGVVGDVELEHYVRRLQNARRLPSLEPGSVCRCGDPQCRLLAAIEDAREVLAPRFTRRTTKVDTREQSSEPPATQAPASPPGPPAVRGPQRVKRLHSRTRRGFHRTGPR
jgi:hypothetical protein